MVRRSYDLPSLTALAVFEAAARHVSFKRAGQELNVTPGAVSRQIKGLEEEMGRRLFERVHRGVRLTAEGEAFYVVLARSFSGMAEAYHRIRSQDRKRSVTLGASSAFASLWLMPRLGKFRRDHADVNINHVVSDNPRDLRLSQVDLRVRYGGGTWPDEDARLLFPDRIYPVCGKGFAKTYRKAAGEGALAGLPLLQPDGAESDWMSWEEWFGRLGLAADDLRVSTFNSYIVALQAAEDDQGLVLGWHSLVAPLVKSGRLRRLSDLEMPAPSAFYLTCNRNRAISTEAEGLRRWLLAQAGGGNSLG